MEDFDYGHDYWNESQWNESPEPLAHPYLIFQLVLVALASVIGLVGHGIIVTLIASRPQLRTVSNLYILNHSVADFITSFCRILVIPNFALKRFLYGFMACKILIFIISVSGLLSSIYLPLFCIDSYLVSRMSQHTADYRKKILKVVSILAWIIGSLLGVPYTLLGNYEEFDVTVTCHEDYSIITNFIFQMLTFVVPFVLNWIFVSIMYPSLNTRAELPDDKAKRLTRLVLLLVITFSVFHTPWSLFTTFGWFLPGPGYLSYSTISLLDINVALNALLYLYYKEDLKSVVFSWIRRDVDRSNAEAEMLPR